jgi:hypothetical protein
VNGAIFLGLAALVGVSAGALAWTQARRAASPTRGDPAMLALSLKRVPADDRLVELGKRAEAGTWEHALAHDALAASGQSARIAAVNLALADVEHALSEGAGWPSAGVRIALLGAALLAFAAYLDGCGIKWSLVIVAVGGAAGISCVEAGRSARRNATRQRRAVDDLVAVVFDGLHAADDPPVPERRSRRRETTRRPRASAS